MSGHIVNAATTAPQQNQPPAPLVGNKRRPPNTNIRAGGARANNCSVTGRYAIIFKPVLQFAVLIAMFRLYKILHTNSSVSLHSYLRKNLTFSVVDNVGCSHSG